LAFFGKSKDNGPNKVPGDSDGAVSASNPNGDVVFSPEKALKFFERARTVQETGNYEYAMQLWLGGLRFDPNSMTGLEAFFAVTPKWLADPASKKGISKEVEKAVSGKSDVDRFLFAILRWGLNPKDQTLAVRAMEAAAKAGLPEPGYWIGERAFATVLSNPKPRKDLLMKIVESFQKIGSYDKAVIAAEQALKLDPTDGNLSAFIRSLAAQATMAKGGYERSGEAGGFRQNIRDADKQRMLEEADRIVKTEDTIDRLLVAASEEYKQRPTDLPTIDKFAKLLRERGRPKDEERAYRLYMQAYEDTKQFRYREQAGDIRIRQARRKVDELVAMLGVKPGDEMLTRMHAQAQQEHAELELAEHKLRVENYPTDLVRKFELGKRYFTVGKFNEAIEVLQEAQADPKNRAAALLFLGQSFLHLQWHDEAIETFRRGLEVKDLASEVQLDMRYWLMAALEQKGKDARDRTIVEEADKIASSIAVQSITFRDIRARREAIKKLLAELRAT
jgi:tetratricopeptide (TPR) repeat protein